MSWLPWELESRIEKLESGVYALAKQVMALQGRPIGEDMSKLHDRLNVLADALKTEATTTVANATENETQFQDIITKMEETIALLKKKNEDDASGGGSTGAGSGAR